MTITAPATLADAIRRDPARFRILTGDRPTGPLHVGHLFGTLENRVRLQDARRRADGARRRPAGAHRPRRAARSRRRRARPRRRLPRGRHRPRTPVIFAHSQVPELNQLLLPFLSLVSVAEVGRNPTVKEEMAATAGRGTSALMFTYPVHQAADILVLPRQPRPRRPRPAPHLELDPHDRAAVQRPLQPRQPLLPGAARDCSARRRSCSASTAAR